MVSKNPSYKRDYKKEDKREDNPQQVRNREMRNNARKMEQKIHREKLSGDVAHIVSLAAGGSNTSKNLRVESVHKNRSWRKGQKGYRVPKDV